MKLKGKDGILDGGKIKITRGGIYPPSPDYIRPEAVSHKRVVTKRPTSSSGSKSGSKKKKP